MKKYFLAALSAVLCMSLAVPAFGAEEAAEYENMAELYHAWCENPGYKYNYPDYVCGVWTETGDMSELVIAVTENEKGEAGKEEILSLIKDDSSVKFVYLKYSYNELRDLQEEMGEYAFDLGIGVWGMGVSEMENCLTLDIDNSESPEMQEFIAECKEKYGDMIAFEEGGAPSLEAEEVVIEAEEVVIEAEEAVIEAETIPEEEILPEAEATAVETAVPATEISEAAPVEISAPYEYEPSIKEGGLVPTVIDDTIEPAFTEEYFELPATEPFGADEIVPDVVYDEGETVAVYFDMAELYQDWYASGKYEYNYPDYVCGVWTETGDMSELVVAVTKDEAGEAGKEEILSLIENDDSVKFTYQSYTYKELRQVQEEITSCMGDESGIYGIGVYEMDNKVHAVIDMSNPNAETTVEKLLAQYGDMLVFEAGSGITLDAETEGFIDSADGNDYTAEVGGGIFAVSSNADGGASEAPAVTMEELQTVTAIGVATEEPDNSIWIFAVCTAAVIALGAVIAFAVSRARAKQTNAGSFADGTRLTAGDVETIVRKTTEQPERDILGAVMEDIEK